jgi:hypothetical protein
MNPLQIPRTNRSHAQAEERRDSASTIEMKARQAAKIRQLGEALAAAGLMTLDKQATALGLSRSTTWTILKGHHKGSGLSTAIIKRMLASPQLPLAVRAVIQEYIDHKTSGQYGDCRRRVRTFAARLGISTSRGAGSPVSNADKRGVRK